MLQLVAGIKNVVFGYDFNVDTKCQLGVFLMAWSY